MDSQETNRRRALAGYLDAKQESLNGWCRRAKVSESTVRGFLAGRTQSLSDRTYDKLALADETTAYVLRGDNNAASTAPKHELPMEPLSDDAHGLESAWETVKKYTEKAPVDIFDLAHALGIELFVKEYEDGETSGEIILLGEDASKTGFVICVNKWHSRARQRFTVAHEISHFLLHQHQIGDGISDDALYRSGLPANIEFEANRLAADILMPAKPLVQAIEKYGQDISELAEHFQVSKSAMSIQLAIPYER